MVKSYLFNGLQGFFAMNSFTGHSGNVIRNSHLLLLRSFCFICASISLAVSSLNIATASTSDVRGLIFGWSRISVSSAQKNLPQDQDINEVFRKFRDNSLSLSQHGGLKVSYNFLFSEIISNIRGQVVSKRNKALNPKLYCIVRVV